MITCIEDLRPTHYCITHPHMLYAFFEGQWYWFYRNWRARLDNGWPHVKESAMEVAYGYRSLIEINPA